MDFFDSTFAAKLEKLAIVSRRSYRGQLQGTRISTRRGHSPEFSDYKNYSQGDDIRFIDWNAFARLDKLYTKLFLEEDDLHVRIIVDTSRSMRTKFNDTRSLLAAFSYIALCCSHRVQLFSVLDNKPLVSQVYRGKQDAVRLFSFLSSLNADSELSPAELTRILSKRKIVGQGFTVICSDFFESEQDLHDVLIPLSSKHSDFFALQVLADDELSPSGSGRVIISDPESTRDSIKTELSNKDLALYKDAIDRYTLHVKEIAGKLGGGYALVNPSLGLEEMVFRSLKCAGLLH